MLKSILVGLDGSPFSKSAVELGIQWGKQYDAMLVGLGIIDEPGVSKVEAMPIGASLYKRKTDVAQLQRAQRKVEQYLERFALRCAEAQVSCKLLEEIGVPCDEILKESQRYDLLLLGQETYFEFESYDEPGKTLHKVLRDSPRPVVTVPKNFKETGDIVVAYDGSLQAAHSLMAFTSLGLYEDGKVHIVSVDSKRINAVHAGELAQDYLNNHDVDSKLHIIESGDPADEILKMIRKLRARLLVMGAYGSTGIKRFFFGSVTKTLLKKVRIPIFLFH